MRVVIADRLAESGLRLLASSDGIEVVNAAGKKDELERALPGAHALIVRSETRVTADVMARAPELKVIARAGTGVDTIDVGAATRRGIAVMNAPGANTVSAAEHAFGLLLALVRHIPPAADSMRRGDWDRKRYEGTELRGKTMGVIGLGRIGGHVAHLARAFGMNVVAHDPFLPDERAVELQVKLLPLDQLLKTADVVSLHLALTSDTQHLINAQRLALMKPTAMIINTARGELVEEAALAAAIKAQKLGGAAIDVFAVEPLPADSALRGLDRVILTPHLAASTAEAQERVAIETATAVRDALLLGDLSTAINVPGSSGEVLRRLGPLLDLARRLGRLAAALVEAPVKSAEVAYGGKDDSAPKPVQVSAVQGLLGGLGVSSVSMVNALMLADERGLKVSLRTSSAEAGFETTVSVSVPTASGGQLRVTGALVGDGHGRVIHIDEFDVDVPPEGCMIVIRNRDVPGVIGRVGTALGNAGINIGSYHQSRRSKPGAHALAAITVDSAPPAAVLEELRQAPGIQDVRLVDFGD